MFHFLKKFKVGRMRRSRSEANLSTTLFESMLLHKPFVEGLLHALSPISFIALCRACPLFKRISLDSFNFTETSFFEYHLERAVVLLADRHCTCVTESTRKEHIADACATFMRSLKSRKHYITGSFVLDVLHGDLTRILAEESDIDIATQYSTKRLQTLGSLSEMLRYDEGMFLSNKRQPSRANDDNEYENMTQIVDVIDCQWNKKRVQFIQIAGTIQAYLDTMDFEFCKNAYGGEQGALVITDLNSVITKHAYVSVSRKYLRRCKGEDFHGPLAVRFFKTAVNRIAKYSARGYHIELGGFSSDFAYGCLFLPHLTKEVWKVFHKQIALPHMAGNPKAEDAIKVWSCLWHSAVVREWTAQHTFKCYLAPGFFFLEEKT